MRPRVLISDGFDPELFQKLKNDSRFDLIDKSKVTPQELHEYLPNINALVIRSKTSITAELLAKAKELKLVIRAGEGVDHIDLAACREKEVVAQNTPGANNNSAAEHAIALMMGLSRHLAKAHASMRAGKWEKSQFTGFELWKKKVGIVGLGRIGKMVAQRLSGLECQIAFYDPFVGAGDVPYKKFETIEEIFGWGDLLTVHVPLMEKTRGIIDDGKLSKLQKHAFFINASRGPIVKTDDLVKHLQQNTFAGAGLDVFETEPLPEDHPLRKLDNVLLTPHLGGSTVEAQYRVGEMVIDQLDQFFFQGQIKHAVT